jgi:ankyrin repeat protein
MTETGYTCRDLIEAVKRDDIVCVMRLLNEGRDPNVRDENGKTPLHHAVLQGPIMVKTLLKYGADPDVVDDRGVTPLHIASMFGLYDVVKLLLSHKRRLNVNVQDEGGKTPLHEAATRCNPDVVRLLLMSGANPNIRDNTGYTPLHSAVLLRPCVDVVKILLEVGADPKCQDEVRQYAASYGGVTRRPETCNASAKAQS